MKITMIQTRPGSRDGINIESFDAGRTYDLADAPSLAATFISLDWAEAETSPPGPDVARPALGPTETRVDGPDETKGQDGDKPAARARATQRTLEEK